MPNRRRGHNFTVLLADDDEDDRFFALEALKENRYITDVRTVNDGEELMDYLLRRGNYSDPQSSPRPALILLDLNMPKKDGREALQEIKSTPGFQKIPIIVLTTSQSEEDIHQSYELGVNSYITKPVSFDGLVNVMKALGQYWFEIVSLP